MSVGGTIVDIVPVSDKKWWVATVDANVSWSVLGPGPIATVYLDPLGNQLQVGDGLWWQAMTCFWTSRVAPDGIPRYSPVPLRAVELPKLSHYVVEHPHKGKSPHGSK